MKQDEKIYYGKLRNIIATKIKDFVDKQTTNVSES